MRLLSLIAAAILSLAAAHAQSYGDYRADAPGAIHHIAPTDLPPPYANQSVGNGPSVVKPPSGATLHVPAGFTVQRFATGLTKPRIVRVAPNGDIFVAESAAGRIRVLRAADGAADPQRNETFATGLDRPFGIAFFPPGPNPQFVYIADNNAIVRFPYQNGDLAARGAPETIVPRLAPTSFHHWTRDIAFSADGKRMFVSVGSASNVAEGMPRLTADAIRAHDAKFGIGAAWGDEELRADVLSFDPDGHNRQVFATGIRNCVGLAIAPQSGAVWCSTNERDNLGDDVPPDYITRVQQGEFFGWPWYYIGAHEDPRHKGERPDLAARISIPDVLIQPHSAPLGMTFYHGAGVAAFPNEYQNDAFVALHGSWNRSKRTGYKIIRVHLKNGVPDGTYQDFVTGFVADADSVWGRPVGVATAHDGALLFTEDGNGTLWRVAWTGPR